ncbi:MAG: hypothetical protein H0T46_23690 [Deltaproteobacteria bacterium]|nr:hypothetical protein [Deltaproteobacteria bacterium]
MLFGGVAVLIVAFALHVAWTARLARDRGRSVVVWILAALMAAAVGLSIGVLVVEKTADAEGAFVGLLGATAPFPLMLVCMLVVVGVLYKLPTHVPLRRDWKVSSGKNGDGTLVIEHEAIELRWGGRTDTIVRSQLRSVVADGECVRLTWESGEVLLMPMMSPQTREGRIRQSELLAKLLTPQGPEPRVS